MLLDESEFMPGQSPGLFDLADYSAGHHRRTGRCAGAGLPSAGDRHAFVDSFDGVVEIAHEVAAAQLAVGEDLEAKILLPFDHSQDVLVFERAQLRGVGHSYFALAEAPPVEEDCRYGLRDT